MKIFLQILLLASAPVCAKTNAVAPSNAAPTAVSLEKIFSADLNRDQREALGPNASLERLRDALTPEQKESARSRLSALETGAKTPEDLAAVARGYLLLDEHSPDAGLGALRVAERMRRLRPKSSDGYELTAEGFNQSGDYPAAAEWAEKALELNPQDANARAIYMFTKDRTKRGDAATNAVAGSPVKAFSAGGSAGVSTEAQALMNRAVEARRRGDVSGMWESAQAAMRADPKSEEVQAFYSQAVSDRAKYVETKADIEKSMAAYESGDDASAVEWARRAAERSQDETVGKILETMKAKVAKRQKAGSGEHPKPAGGAPLWPLAGLGLATGYGLYRGTKRTYASEDGLNPEPEVASDQARKNYLTAAAVAGAAFLGLAAWEFGPGALALLNTAGPSTPTMAPAFAGTAGSGVVLVSEPSAVGAAQAGLTLVGTSIGAKTISDNVSLSKRNVGPDAAGRRQTPPSSDIKKPSANDPELKNLIDDLFQPTDTKPGGTAGAVREEVSSGEPTQGRFHLSKAKQYINALDNLLRRRAAGRGVPLDPVDRATAEALRQDLENAVNSAAKKP